MNNVHHNLQLIVISVLLNIYRSSLNVTMFFPVHPVCHNFVILLSTVSMAASVDGHLPFLAACHCSWLCLCYFFIWLFG